METSRKGIAMWKLLLVSGLLASPAFAQVGASAVPGFSAQGPGNWEMICHVLADGDQNSVILSSSRPGYANKALKTASCDYHASGKGDLVLTITGAAKCPLKGATDEACTITVPRQRAGSFSFKVKGV